MIDHHRVERRIRRDAGLQAGADRAGVGARELEERGSAEALGVRGVEPGRRREVVVEPDARVEAAEGAGAVRAGAVAAGAGVADLVAQPVEARGGDRADGSDSCLREL